MSDAQLNRMKSVGVLLLAILTLGIFKSVYRRLITPFRQLFLFMISTGYSFLIALALFCAIAHELKVVTDHFQDMKPLLSSQRFGFAIFGALYLSVWVTLTASLSWYFNELTLKEKTQRASTRVMGWFQSLGQRVRKLA